MVGRGKRDVWDEGGERRTIWACWGTVGGSWGKERGIELEGEAERGGIRSRQTLPGVGDAREANSIKEI